MLDDGVNTPTSTAQTALERKVVGLYQELEHLQEDEMAEELGLLREVHTAYLHRGLGELGSSYAALDASRPWICFWILHSLALLEARMPDTPTADEVVRFLGQCQNPGGGFGGGPMQISHLAPTYAAVCALITIGTESALSLVDRTAMYSFLQRMCVPPERGGGFSVHEGGEADLRACYIAMAVAHMLALDKAALSQRAGLAQFIRRCQTYEGGLGGEPGNEAHGGYTYCGLAAATLAGVASTALDVPALARWAAHRQGAAEGGFNGRTNKLVDGCYSFWQGGLFPLLQRLWAPPGATQRSEGASHEPSCGGGEEEADSEEDDGVPEVPVLPPLVVQARTPAEQASLIFQTRSQTAQQVVADGLAAGEAVDASMRSGATARQTASESAAAREMLDRANKMQSLVEHAHYDVSMAVHSASSIFPVPEPLDPPAPTVPGAGGAQLPNPLLYNHKALQLWILRCCQQSKGGLRDKPGKPPDYYHTCYCLSGLSQAQHSSNLVVGPRENLLRRADPLCNVADDKLMSALHFFRKRPIAGASAP